MKLYLKQFSALFALLILNFLVAPFLLSYIGRKLYQFRITNFFIHYREANGLILIVLYFLIGYYLVNKIKLVKDMKNRYIIAFLFLFHIGITLFFQLKRHDLLHFHSINISLLLGYTLKELSGLLGFVIGLLFRKIRYKYSLIIPVSILTLFLVFTYKITLPFSSQYYVYGNFSGQSNNQNHIDTLALRNNNGEQVNINTSDKIIAIDFWNKNCGLCFQKFPLVKKMQKKYQTNDSVLVIAVNIYKEDKEITTSEKLLKQTDNEDLVNYYLPKENSGIFDVKWYPKTIVIKNGEIIFEGHIEILKFYENVYLQ